MKATPPSSPPNQFRNLRTALTRGLLTKVVRVGDIRFVLKQVTQEEIRQVGYFLPSSGRPQDEMIYLRASFVALGLLFLGDEYMIPHRPLELPSIIKVIVRWPKMLVDQLFQELMGLTSLFYSQMERVPLFADLPESRTLWKGLPTGVLLCSDTMTGWPQSERLGLNVIQRTWMAYQRLLDDMDEFDRLWQGLKWIVACQSREAVQKMEQIEGARREHRKMLGRKSAYDKSGKLVGEKTEQDLLRELKDSAEGRFDEHDMAVIQKENAFMEEYLASEEALRQKAQEFLDSEMPRVSAASHEIDLVELRKRHLRRHGVVSNPSIPGDHVDAEGISERYGVEMVKGPDGVMYSRAKAPVSVPTFERDGNRIIRRG